MSKLDNFPPLYYINLDDRIDRNVYMTTMLHKHNIKGTRISAINGRLGQHVEYIDEIPNRLRPNEIACTISHLRAIQYWLQTSDSETAIICEDDISFDESCKWPFSWSDVVSSLPFYWEILQCCVIFHPQHEIIVNLHHRTSYDYSAACYLIKRSYAERLLSYYWNSNTLKWNLTYKSPFPLTSEETVYRPGVCLTIPLFTFTNEHGSDIQTSEHLETYHTFSKKIYTTLWNQVQLIDKSITILTIHPQIVFKQ